MVRFKWDTCAVSTRYCYYNSLLTIIRRYTLSSPITFFFFFFFPVHNTHSINAIIMGFFFQFFQFFFATPNGRSVFRTRRFFKMNSTFSLRYRQSFTCYAFIDHSPTSIDHFRSTRKEFQQNVRAISDFLTIFFFLFSIRKFNFFFFFVK